MLLLIDNYDSFTYNLVHYLGELGTEIVVRRNDAIDVQEAMTMNPAGILLSPGPCDPDQAGICLALTRAAAETKTPLMGGVFGASNDRSGLWRKLWCGVMKLCTGKWARCITMIKACSKAFQHPLRRHAIIH